MKDRKFITSSSEASGVAGTLHIKDVSFSDRVASHEVPEGGVVFDGLSVLICRKGLFVVLIGDREYELSSNQVLIMMPYRIVKPVSQSEDCQISGFFLSVDLYLKNNSGLIDFNIIRQLNEHPLVSFTSVQMERLCELNSVMVDRLDNIGDPYSYTCVNALVTAFLAEIKSVYESKASECQRVVPTRQESLTDNFFRLLFQSYTQERSVSFYAGKMCLSPKYLSSIIKKVTGFSVLEWINEMTINRIKSLLKTTDFTVLQISQELNFSNPSFFGKFFKQYTGQTPLEYKFGG